MRQLHAPDPASDGADWLYYRIHETSTGRLDALLEHVVRPAVDRLRAHDPAGQWFFLRYLDGSGLHLRLRLRGDEAVLAEVEAWLDGRLADLFAGRLPARGLEAPPEGAGRRGASQHVYEPELDKWGGPSGVARAETVFEASSAFVLAEFARRPADWSRLACAAAVTARAVRLLPPELRQGFLYHYAWYWCGRESMRSTAAGAMRSTAAGAMTRAAARRSGSRLAAAGLASDARAADAYIHALDRALEADPRQGDRRWPTHVLFHHIHLTNNRLGVTPREEAVLAEVLRTQPSLIFGR